MTHNLHGAYLAAEKCREDALQNAEQRQLAALAKTPGKSPGSLLCLCLSRLGHGLRQWLTAPAVETRTPHSVPRKL